MGNQYIEDLKAKYEEMYERSLEDDVDAIDEDGAEADAQELYDAGEDRWLFTDESVFTRIMARRSWMQIRLIAAKYEDISGSTLIQAINDECRGDTERAYKAVVRMACDT